MKKVFVFASMLIMLAACGTNNQQTNPVDSTTQFVVSEDKEKQKDSKKEEKTDVTEFATFLQTFISTVKTYKDLAQYTENGEYLLVDNPGAFPIISWQNKNTEPTYALLNYTFTTQYTPIEGNMPEYSCETESWSAEGCFMSNVQKDFISGYVKVLEEYLETPKTQTMLMHKRAKEMSGQKSYIAYITDATVGFYFYRKDGKFYLYMVDIVMPCSA